jgi:uncharacterized membrane protein YphA (DoxX/SURF4 family)
METNPPVAADAPKGRATNSFTRHLPTVARILMGLAFFVFGLNGFLNFIPPPSKPMPEGAMAFVGGLMKSGYMFPLIAGTQLLVGVLLLLNRFVPLALVLIMPVLVNIIAFHVFLQPAGIAPGIVLMILELYLAWTYRHAYCPMLAARVTPGGE